MSSRDFQLGDDDDFATTNNRPRASAPQHSSRKQFSYARGRKKATTHFNGMHRRRSNKWSW